MHAQLARFRSLWRGLCRRDDVEADMADEFRHHLELRTEDLIRRRLSPVGAARQARIEFGHLESREYERPGAPPVVVLGSAEWRRRFGGDPAIIGRPVRFDATVHTVAGVMPEGFHFPVNHSYRVPLRPVPTAHRLAVASGGVVGRQAVRRAGPRWRSRTWPPSASPRADASPHCGPHPRPRGARGPADGGVAGRIDGGVGRASGR